MDRAEILRVLASEVGKPLADRKAKQTQAARDAYKDIANGAEVKPALDNLLTKLGSKKCKPQKDIVKKLCKDAPVPPLRLKWCYPLVPWY